MIDIIKLWGILCKYFIYKIDNCKPSTCYCQKNKKTVCKNSSKCTFRPCLFRQKTIYVKTEFPMLDSLGKHGQRKTNHLIKEKLCLFGLKCFCSHWVKNIFRNHNDFFFSFFSHSPFSRTWRLLSLCLPHLSRDSHHC